MFRHFRPCCVRGWVSCSVSSLSGTEGEFLFSELGVRKPSFCDDRTFTWPYVSWAIGVMLGSVVSGGVSGGHLNPAITVAVASVGKFPLRKVQILFIYFSCYFNILVQVPHYLAAQYLGAFLASCVVFLVYWDALVW